MSDKNLDKTAKRFAGGSNGGPNFLLDEDCFLKAIAYMLMYLLVNRYDTHLIFSPYLPRKQIELHVGADLAYQSHPSNLLKLAYLNPL